MLRSYVAFDLETTGLSVEENCIIEVGALKVRGRRCGRAFYDFCKTGGDDFSKDHRDYRDNQRHGRKGSDGGRSDEGFCRFL